MRTFVVALFLGVATSAAHAFDLPESVCLNPVDCARKSVVSLLPDWPENSNRREEPEGSGIVLADGTLLATADHVLGPAKSAKIRTRDGKVIEAQIVARDRLTDIAFLKIDEKLTPFARMGPTEVAAKACAIGNAFGLDLSVNCGVVSATGMSGTGFNPIEDFLQTDAAVNPGMSGGALVDENGSLTGMLSAIFTRQSDANIGVNFAVSALLLEKAVASYQSNGKINFLRPGVILRQNNPSENGGLLGNMVLRVISGSVEDKAGIMPNDVIIMAGNRRIKRPGSYEAAIALAESGKPLDLLVLRGKDQLQIKLNIQ